MAGWLPACVPMKETFYTPSAEGGETIGSTCHGKAGTPNVIVFQHPEARIRISAIETKPIMSVSFSIAEGISLSVPATQFRITTKKKNELLILNKLRQHQDTLNVLESSKMTDLPLKEELVLPGKKLRTFFLTFLIDVDQANEFVLIFPVLLANEKKYQFRPSPGP